MVLRGGDRRRSRNPSFTFSARLNLPGEGLWLCPPPRERGCIYVKPMRDQGRGQSSYLRLSKPMCPAFHIPDSQVPCPNVGPHGKWRKVAPIPRLQPRQMVPWRMAVRQSERPGPKRAGVASGWVRF